METNEIFDTSVAINKKDGLITIFSVVEYPPSVKRSFDIIFPEAFDYIKAIEIADKLRGVGKPIGAIDIIIAAMCITRSLKLVTKDHDFESVKYVFPQFELQLLE